MFYKGFVDNYVDDCIVFSNDMTAHIQDLKRVLSQLSTAGFTLCGSKCFFFWEEQHHPSWLWIFRWRSSHSLEKTKTISTWPVPKTTKDVHSFLGLVNFYHHSSPLTELTCKNAQFQWESTHQHSFDTLKHALISPPILQATWNLCAYHWCIRHQLRCSPVHRQRHSHWVC